MWIKKDFFPEDEMLHIYLKLLIRGSVPVNGGEYI